MRHPRFRQRPARSRDESGAAAVIVVVFIGALLFGLAAITVDIARLHLEGERVQKAADAAAMAGVTWMPQDLGQATSVARDVSSRNGYPNSGSSTVTVKTGHQPSQLDVTVTSTVDNIFGRLFGIGSGTVSRHAISDYTGPQPMGSPCNTFGNEPEGTPNALPVGSQLQVPVNADCPQYPQFWMNVNGPEIFKGSGDEYGVRKCEADNNHGLKIFGCTGATNDEFRPEGYFLLVRVTKDAIGQPVTIQLYDPAFVETNDTCTAGVLQDFGTIANNMNIYAPDAVERYKKTTSSPNRFCTGDNQNQKSKDATITSYGLRKPAGSQNPLDGEPVGGCTRQYPGYYYPDLDEGKDSRGRQRPNLDGFQAKYLTSTDPAYNADLARVFHQWASLCTFTPDQAGDYYLQVRTNVALGGPVNDAASYKPADAASSKVFTQAGDDLSVQGGGSNRFAVRAYGGPSGSVSVAAYGRMPIYANATAASSTFNLIRVLPGAAGKTMVFKFFDVGDVSGNTGGVVQVLPPTEWTTALKDCTGTGYKTEPLPTCSVSGVKTDPWNGQSETINVPVPIGYTCDVNSAGGCWFRVKVTFTAGVTDTTTWTASIVGDPVRLIE
jgi:Flp pilus assembly protein TadG